MYNLDVLRLFCIGFKCRVRGSGNSNFIITAVRQANFSEFDYLIVRREGGLEFTEWPRNVNVFEYNVLLESKPLLKLL